MRQRRTVKKINLYLLPRFILQILFFLHVC